VDLLPQGLAVDKLHRYEVHAVAFTNFVNVRDVRMIERRRSFGFLLKPPHPIMIGGSRWRPELSPQRSIPPLAEIDLTADAGDGTGSG
jgi:hypothetical protein